MLACDDGSPASVAALRFAAAEAELREVPLIVANVYDGDGPAAKQLLTETALPVKWDAGAVVWKTTLKGTGQSSVVNWGDRIFVTSATADGSTRWVFLERGAGD